MFNLADKNNVLEALPEAIRVFTEQVREAFRCSSPNGGLEHWFRKGGGQASEWFRDKAHEGAPVDWEIWIYLAPHEFVKGSQDNPQRGLSGHEIRLGDILDLFDEGTKPLISFRNMGGYNGPEPYFYGKVSQCDVLLHLLVEPDVEPRIVIDLNRDLMWKKGEEPEVTE